MTNLSNTSDIPHSPTSIDNEFDNLNATSTQKQLIADMGVSLANSLDMKIPTLRGFFALAMIEWQQNIGMSVAETEIHLSPDPSTRVRSASEILEIVRTKLLPVVKNHGKDNLLDGAIAEALDLYSREYANRPPDLIA